MTLFRHQTSTYLHGRADKFVVSVSNGQVAALSDWAIINRLWLQAVSLTTRLICRLGNTTTTQHLVGIRAHAMVCSLEYIQMSR